MVLKFQYYLNLSEAAGLILMYLKECSQSSRLLYVELFLVSSPEPSNRMNPLSRLTVRQHSRDFHKQSKATCRAVRAAVTQP